MKLISLTLENGKPIHINPQFIASMTPYGKDGGTMVNLSQIVGYAVRENVKEIRALIVTSNTI